MPDTHRASQTVIITVSIIVILLESTTVVLELWAASGDPGEDDELRAIEGVRDA